MKKLIFTLSCFVFLYGETPLEEPDPQNAENTFQKTEILQKTESMPQALEDSIQIEPTDDANSVKFFIRAGGGLLIAPKTYRNSFWALTLGAGILIPTQIGIQHLLSLDVEYVFFKDWFAAFKTSPPRSDPVHKVITSDGQRTQITLNYGLDIPLFFEGTRLIPVLGLGMERASAKIDVLGAKNAKSSNAFIIVPSLTLRQFIIRPIAIDLTYKTQALSTSAIGKTYFLRHYFFLSLAFEF